MEEERYLKVFKTPSDLGPNLEEIIILKNLRKVSD